MSIIDTAKDIYSLAAKGLTIDLQEKLMQLREQALELQEENLSLRSQLLTLRQQLDRKENLEFDGSVYRDEKGTYCPTCHDKDNKLIRLQINKNPATDARWYCDACHAFF